MNPTFKLFLLSFGLCALASCSSDSPESPVSNNGCFEPVTLKVAFGKMNAHESDTRSLAPGYKYADGSSISVLKCYVYNRSLGQSADPIKVVDIDVKAVGDKRGGDVSVMLPKGQTFDMVFLGTSIPQTNASTKLYYTTTDRTLNLNYSLISCNDEEIDCFYAVAEGVTTETVFEESIELTRPLAQVNIGTQDYAEYNAASPVKDIAVSVDGVYSSMDLMTGQIKGDPEKASFKASPVPGSSQVYPVAGFSYLTMNYVLVNLRKLVTVSMSVYHTDATPTQTITVNDVAVERNYQSNIYGKKLLTEYNLMNP